MTTTSWLLRESKLPKAPSWSIVFGFAILYHLLFTKEDKLLMVGLISPFLIGSLVFKKIKNPTVRYHTGVVSGLLYFVSVIVYLQATGNYG